MSSGSCSNANLIAVPGRLVQERSLNQHQSFHQRRGNEATSEETAQGPNTANGDKNVNNKSKNL